MPPNALSVLSLGGGQDSIAILCLLARRPGFRERYVGNADLLTVMSDTGNEDPLTYDYVRGHVEDLCKVARSDWKFLTPDLGYHPETWQSLPAYFEHYTAIGSKAYPKSCTDNLKLVPIYRFLEDYLGRKYGFATGRKKAFYAYREMYGELPMMIGITKEEETRRIGDRSKESKWMRTCVSKVYPLVEFGLTRADCQELIRSYSRPIPIPSNCMFCPFVSEVELLWLWTFRRADYEKWVIYEAAKLERFKYKGDKNFGVFGRKTLSEVLAVAREKYKDWTEAQLWEYKMSHGHGVCSKH